MVRQARKMEINYLLSILKKKKLINEVTQAATEKSCLHLLGHQSLQSWLTLAQVVCFSQAKGTDLHAWLSPQRKGKASFWTGAT